MNNANERLTDSFRRVSALMRRDRHREMKGNAPTTQNRVLTILSLNDGINQRQLSYILGIRPQSSGELIAKMEMSDLVVRVRDENDNRAHLIYLTEQGKAKAKELKSSFTSTIFDCLNDEEKLVMQSYLDRIIESSADRGEAEGERNDRCHRRHCHRDEERNEGCHRPEGETGFPEKGFEFPRRPEGRFPERGRDFRCHQPRGMFPERRFHHGHHRREREF